MNIKVLPFENIDAVLVEINKKITWLGCKLFF